VGLVSYDLRRTEWVPPEHPAPLVSARPIEWLIVRKKSGGIKSILGDVEMPSSALAFAKAMHDLPGWTFLATFALGWDMNADGSTKKDRIMEPTGEVTRTGRPAMTMVGEVERAAVPSVLLRAVARRNGRACVLAGFWVDGTLDHGMVMIPPGLAGLRMITATALTKWRDDLHNVEVDQVSPEPVHDQQPAPGGTLR
jgi:hypothetical protein